MQFDSQKWKESLPEELTAADAGNAPMPKREDVEAISSALSSLLVREAIPVILISIVLHIGAM